MGKTIPYTYIVRVYKAPGLVTQPLAVGLHLVGFVVEEGIFAMVFCYVQGTVGQF